MINREIEKQAELLKAVGHPARLAIVKGLAVNECNVNKMVAGLDLPQSTVSQHLNVLKAAGIIEGERRGVKVCYRVVDPFIRKVLQIK
ncbi:MAG: metalloregulator ArsR/SmtB family transcription factor [Syntrophales bacterium]